MVNSQIKTIGFFKEHDETFVLNKYIEDDANFDSSILSEAEKKKIIDYLNEGTMVFSTPLALFDGSNYIASRMLLSDGKWIWTSHFAYYLNKLNFSRMTNEFLNHLRNKEYEHLPLSKEQRTNIELFLGLKMLNLADKVRESIRRNAVNLGYDVSEK